MAPRTTPGIGLASEYNLGENGWKEGMDANLLKLATLVNTGVEARVAVLPTSPTEGQMYLVTAGGNANRIALRDKNSWVFYTPKAGYRVFVKNLRQEYTFDGNVWFPLLTDFGDAIQIAEEQADRATAQAELAEADALTTEANRILTAADRATTLDARDVTLTARDVTLAASAGAQTAYATYVSLAAGMAEAGISTQFQVASENEVVRYEKTGASSYVVRARVPTSGKANKTQIKAEVPTSTFAEVAYSVTNGGFIDTRGGGAIVSEPNYSYGYIPVTAGELLLMSNALSGNRVALASWFDASGTFLGVTGQSVSGSTTTWVDEPVLVPDGAVTLGITRRNNFPKTPVKRGTQKKLLAYEVDANTLRLAAISSQLASSIQVLTQVAGEATVVGQYIKFDNGDVLANAGYSYKKFPVTPGETIYVTARIVGSETALAVFYDAGGSYRGYVEQALSGTAVTFTDHPIVVPVGATKVALCSQNSSGVPMTVETYQAVPNLPARLTAVEQGIGALPKQLTIKNSDKISLAGDSYTQSIYTPKGKAWLAKASLFSDWNFENFAVSGETYQKNLERLRNGTLTYGNVSLKDYGSTYLVAMTLINDGSRSILAEYQDDVRAFVETARGIGAIPVIANEWVEAYSSNGGSALRMIAEQMGVLFVDIYPAARLFMAVQPARFMGSGHPGVRTNEVISEPMEEFARSLGRPRQSLKLFRKRPAVAVGAVDDLLFDSRWDRAKLFKEILVGHNALTAAKVEWYDKLDDTANYSTELIQSEYLKLQAGVAVGWADYGLVEAIVDATVENLASVALVLSDPDIQVYVRDVLAAPYEAATQYQRFDVAAPVSPVVGATYTSDAAALSGTTFTVVGEWNGAVMMSPNPRGNGGAGTLTRTGGTGPTTIAYTGYRSGFPAAYYTNFGKPEGHWVALAGTAGVFPVGGLRGKVQFDKLSFLLYKAGGFSLTNCRVDYQVSKTGKPAFPYRSQLRTRPARGVELLTQPLVGSSGNLAQWGLSEGAPAAITPEDGALPRGITGICRVSPTVKLGQVTNGFATADDEQREAEIRIWARRYPAIYEPGAGSPPVTEDSFDWDRLIVSFARDSNIIPFKEKVGLWWKQVVFRGIVPVNTTTMQLRIWAETGIIEIGKASVKFVD
jgi:hypothetical protein